MTTETTPDVRPLLTVPEVAERLSLAECTIYDLLKTGKIPGLKIGGAWRISPVRLDEALAAMEHTPCASE